MILGNKLSGTVVYFSPTREYPLMKEKPADRRIRELSGCYDLQAYPASPTQGVGDGLFVGLSFR